MRRVLYAAGLIFLPVLALAGGFPAAFDVTGVVQSDALNIRAEPSASAPVIGAIGPNATSVEVLETTADGAWGKVGHAEGNGWVAMRYLSATPEPDPEHVPRPLSCFGTEPFWSIGLFQSGPEYNSPDTGAVPLTLLDEASSPQGYLVRLEEGPAIERTLIVRRARCSDGMSDREFGFSAFVFLTSPEGNATLSGCCTLDHR